MKDKIDQNNNWLSVSESTDDQEQPTGKFYVYVESEIVSKHFDSKEEAEAFKTELKAKLDGLFESKTPTPKRAIGFKFIHKTGEELTVDQHLRYCPQEGWLYLCSNNTAYADYEIDYSIALYEDFENKK